jgi:CubicO group peptidase (beta-lactamase class C family)
MNTAARRFRTALICWGVSASLLTLSAGATPTAQTSGEATMVEEFDTLLTELVKQELFSGAVLVARGDEVLFEAARGLASRRYGVPNLLDTRFHMGSISKIFTGVAICQLAEQGKLDFDDPIIQHLPDYPNRVVAETVTIHHLLSHTSGMGGYFNEAYEAAMSGLTSISDFLYFPDHGYTMVVLANIDGGSQMPSRYLSTKLFELAANTAGR